jgi:hypothetical protein
LDLVVAFVRGEVGVVGQYLLSFVVASDFVDREALAGGLGGADSTVVHVFVLDVDDVFCLLVVVVFVGAEEVSV